MPATAAGTFGWCAMRETACAYCGAPVPDGVGERVGAVRFCGRLHVAEWYSLPVHDRRHARVYAPVERRQG